MYCYSTESYWINLIFKMDVASTSNYRRLLEADSPKLHNNGIRLHEEPLSQQQLDGCAGQREPWNHLGIMQKDGEGKTEADMYGKLYGYALKTRKYLRSKSWTFRRAEIAVGRWLWRLQKDWSRGNFHPEQSQTGC